MMKRLGISVLAVAAAALAAPVAYACSAFLVADDNVVLYGNNEDHWNPLIKMWVIPGRDGAYGRVCFGYDNYYPQGGMNEKGLVFDGFATGSHPVTKSLERPKFVGNIIDEALARCATVDEALALFERHNLAFMERCMFMFADREGNAAIIEGDEVLRKDGRFQIVTNFYQSQHPSGDYPCSRYRTAHRMLSGAEDFSVGLCERVLDSVHAEGRASTLYSNVYDLTKGTVNLYLFHDFEHPVVINLAEELKQGEHYVDIPSLFPARPEWEKYERTQLASMEERVAKRVIVEVDPRALAAYVGTYKAAEGVGTGALLKFWVRDGKLFGKSGHHPDEELRPVSATDFFHPIFERDFDLSFVREGDDPASAVIIRTAGQTFNCKRVE
jgi:hypothetical protein